MNVQIRPLRRSIRFTTINILTVLMVAVFAWTAEARVCTTVVSGSWLNATTWDCGGGVGDNPLGTDDVVIAHDIGYSSGSTTNVLSLTVQGVGSLDLGVETFGQTLTVNGNVMVDGAITNTNFTGNLQVNGPSALGGTGSIDSPVSIGGAVTTSGNLVINNDVNVNSNASLTMAGALRINGRLSMGSPSLVDIAGSSLDLDGDLDASHCPAFECGVDEYAVLRLGSGSLNIAGDFPAPSDFFGGPHLEAETGTVVYDGPGQQEFTNSAPYYNLIFASSDFADFAPSYAQFWDRNTNSMVTGPTRVMNELRMQSGAKVSSAGAGFDGMGSARFTMGSGSALWVMDANSDGNFIFDVPAAAPTGFVAGGSLAADSQIFFSSSTGPVQSIPPMPGGYGSVLVCSNVTGICVPPQEIIVAAVTPSGSADATTSGSRPRAVSGDFGPVKVQAALVKAATGDLVINGDLSILNGDGDTLTLDMAGFDLDLNGDLVGNGALAMSGSAVGGDLMSIGGSFSPTIVFTPPNRMIFDGAAQQILSAISYFDLQLSGSGVKTPDGNLSLAGDFIVDSGVTFNTLVAGFHFVDGDLVADGTFSGTGEIGMAGSAAQTLSGSGANFPNLSIQCLGCSVAVASGTNVTVAGSLTMFAGVLQIPAGNPLTILPGGTILRDPLEMSGMIDGPVVWQFNSVGTYTFPFGDGLVYEPITINIDSLTATPASMAIAPFDVGHLSAPAGSLQSYWQIDTVNVGQADLTVTYDQGDVPGTTDEARLLLARWNESEWVSQPSTIDTTGNQATALDVTQFSPWTLVPAAVCQVVVTADSGTGSLRDAIDQANLGNCSAITFAIGGTGPHTINLQSNLPILSQDGVSIDGFTQTGASANTAAFGTASNANHQIVITGSSPSVNGLQINGSNNVVTGLWFGGLTDAILVSGTLTDSNIISGNVFHSSNRGVVVNTGAGNVVGGAAAADRNVFDNMSGASIQLDGSSAGTSVRGNYVGFDPSGFTPSGNFGWGVLVQGSNGNTIDQNVVSNSGLSTGRAIEINGNTNSITNNRIGTTLNGSGSMANGSSGGSVGVALAGGSSNTVSGNLIGGHDQGGFSQFETGIYVSSSGNDIFSNKIGTDLAGSGAIPNRFGIIFDAGATGNVVGGGLGANTIMNNVLDGIVAFGGTGNTWVENVISLNGAMAIDLDDDDVVNNDAADADAGANGLQNAPTITSAVLNGATLSTTVSLDSSSPNPAAILVEIVKTDADGEINAPLGSQCLAGSVLVNAPVSVPAGTLSGGDLVAALATSYADTNCVSVAEGSSEVGASFAVIIETDIEIVKSGPATGTRGETVAFTLTVNNLGLVDAAGVTVDDPEPAGLTHLSNSGDCATPFPCALGTVPAGSTKTITATYMIEASASRTVTNSATVTMSTPEANLTNNSSSATLGLCPLTPTGLQPADGASSVPRSGSLSWTDSGSNVYEVYFGPVGSGCSTLSARVAGRTSFPFYSLGLAEDQDYEWRIVATATGCPDAASACQVFSTGSDSPCPTARPELLEPATSSTVSSPVGFAWTAVDGAVSYDVVADQGAGPVVVASTPTTSASVALPQGAVTWYVEAHFGGDCSTQSFSSTFSVEGGECTDESPELLSPANGATSLSSPLQFSWLAVPGASSYRVWVESENSFPVVVGTTAGTSLTATVPSGELHWYVQALFEGCPPTISEIRTVQVNPRDNCSAAVPALIAPEFDAVLDSPITFSWTPVAGAIRYAVWASIDGDTESIVGTTEGEDSTTLEREMDAGEIEWFVEVFFDGCPSNRTEPSRFRVNDNFVCVTDVPQLLLPADGATDLPGLVKFEWNTVPTAVGYRLWMRADGVGEFEMAGSTLAETELQMPVRGNLIEWYIEAVFPAPCQPTRSEENSFLLKPPVSCGDDVPGLIAPVGGITLDDRRVKLMWTGVEGAAAYNVWVARENGAHSRVGLTANDELSIEVDLEEGVHEWWVTAVFAGCSPTESERQTFVVDERVPEDCESSSQLLLISPSEGAANVVSPVIFEWTEVPEAIGYQIWLLEGENDTKRSLGGVRETTQAVVQTKVGTIRWYVEAYREGCDPVVSSIQHFKVKPAGLTCEIPDKPQVYVPQKVASGTEYRLSWDQVPGATVYEVQESTSRVFRGLSNRVVRGTSTSYMHTLSGQGTFYYRVRAIGDCNGERSSYSQVSVVTVDASSGGPEASARRGYRVSAEELTGSEILELNKDAYSQNGVEEFVVVLRSPGAEPETVRLVPDQSWMTVDPEVVTLTPGGVSVTVRADMAALPLGTSSATLRYEPVEGGKGASQGGTVPVSVSLVTPVAQSGKNKPLPESLVIPAVAHADGANSTWLSDVRLTNIGAVTQKYQLNFTPAGVDGTTTGKTTNLEVKPGSTVALNDILANWYGAVGVEAQQTGMLEIRPMKSSTSSSIGGLAAVASGGFTSMASSRTYNSTPSGTFGQFIPAVRFEKFIGVETDADGSPRLSMQQISQSSSFRTNLGIVEASGNAVDALVSVFDASGSLIGSFTESLKPGEHKQLNSVLQTQGISVENGRIEVTAANGQGRLMAYGSVVDNTTNDPQLVPAATLGTDSGTKWVLPGVADLVTGRASWRTDVRILNADSQPREVKLTYYPQNDPGVSKEATVTLNAGEIEVLDNVLNSFFGESNTGGVVHVETEASSNLVTTGRTYNLGGDGGTFGQFIPAVNASRAVGRGEQALQIMQVEQSDRFRANLGLAEVTGQPAQVEITAVIPGSKSSVRALVPLKGNEFTQLVGVLNSLGISEAYNARISVRVVNGGGRVVAYGSIIDNETQDPTYVPAQ